MRDSNDVMSQPDEMTKEERDEDQREHDELMRLWDDFYKAHPEATKVWSHDLIREERDER